jgi:RNA polymerase sigma-70 factor (ECF subfamily)
VPLAVDRALDETVRAEALTLESIYDAWFHEVSRWARALGGLDADVDDVAQEVFVVVRRKLAGFRGQNLPGWLYGITSRVVRDQRRRAWFRHLVRGRAMVSLDELRSPAPGPMEALDEKESRRRLQALLDQLSEKRRSAFVLYEIEGYSGEEIAALQGIPVATVWTRLHHARRDLTALVARARAKERG